MLSRLRHILLILFYVFPIVVANSEGTRELYANNCANKGSIQIWDNGDTNRKFATYNTSENYRLHVRVNYQDYIHLGFGYDPSNGNHNINAGDVWFRVKDPTDSVVFGPIRIQPSMGEGWIDNCNEAITGPASLFGSGGYNDTFFIAEMAGDYYVEFAEDNDSSLHNKRVIQWFDITVSEEGLIERPGRVWSRQWDINLLSGGNQFMASMYAYSKDSVVSKFDFNGIQPYGFSISCNSYGASNVGTFNERRVSDYRTNIQNNGGTPSAPEYPLFINPPDVAEFPEGTFGIIDSFALYSCLDTINCIEVYTNKPGQVEMVLTFQNGTQQNIIDTVGPGGNCLEWNGMDGNGNPLQAGDTVDISLKYATGITHLPLTDVENHLNGFNVEIIRPTSKPNGDSIPDPLLFWDDSRLNDPHNSLDGVTNLTGGGAGSHQWDDRGSNNSNPEVINTWWYAALEEQTYIVVCPALLPVDILEWEGAATVRGNQLYWTTGVEENIDHYVVERSLDGQHFDALGKVQANNQHSSQYAFLDPQPPAAPVVYYRLKVLDRAGASKLSDIIAIRPAGMANADFIWHPGAHTFQLQSDQRVNFAYRIVSLIGEQVARGILTTNQMQQVSLPSAGLYMVSYRPEQGEGWTTRKVIAY